MSEAATRNAWRWLLAAAAAAARLRVVDDAVPFAAVARVVRVDFAASPRAAAASADAARDAAVRFEGAGCFVSPSAAVVAAGFLGAGFDAPLRAAVDFAAVDFAAAAFAAADFSSDDFAAGFAGVRFAAGFSAAGFASAAFSAADFAAAGSFSAVDFAGGFFSAVDFAAGLAALDFAAADLAAAVLFVAPERAGVDEFSAAAPVGDSPVSGTPVPVPSAASSSWFERETEVTKPTYQDGPLSAHSGLVTPSAKLGIH